MNRRERGVHRARRRPPIRVPSIPQGLDPQGLTAAHEATRALLTAQSPREVVDIVFDLVVALGAVVVPARIAGPDQLPLDLSFGVGEPMLAQAEPAGITRMHLETLLPSFVEDARRVVMGLRQTAQLRDEASMDQLTGLLNRRSWDRQLHQLRDGYTVAMIDFDDFEPLRDVAGPAAGDAVLASFGPLLRDFLRAGDLAARYDDHRLAVGALGGGPPLLSLRLGQLRRVWESVRPHSVTFRAGIAAVDTTVIAAVSEATRALSAAKLAARPNADDHMTRRPEPIRSTPPWI